jgi:3-phenylpropionate/trans-cinnamate dioxygenase ferredoxin reductase subunit
MQFGDRVAAFEGAGRVERVVTASGRRLECDFAVIGLGVEPATEVAAGTAVEVDNGILVDEFCRTNMGAIYAAGDVANHYHPVFGRRMRIEHWQNAMRQGRAAALNMLDRNTPYAEIPWFWSDQYEHNLQYAGHHVDWDDVVIRGSLEERNFLAFYLKGERVQSLVAMDRGPELGRATRLIGSAESLERVDLLNEDVDLAMLA